jgi:hypothetical protein
MTIVEEVHGEAGQPISPPKRKAAAVAVIKNPYAGQYVEDLGLLMDYGEQLGAMLGSRAVAALGIPKEKAENYGKGAIVGLDGELEHLHAILHPKLGKPLRDEVGGGKAIIPSAGKQGPAGTALDVPLHYKDAAFVRSHYDAMEIRVPDAPRSDEIVVIVVVTDAGRLLPRIGGLTKEAVKGEDGLR